MSRTSPTTATADSATRDADVVIVGGGPAGCAAGVYTARDGLETIVFDRGRSSIARCAHLENYLGFPGGIDVETFTALAHDHAESEGCEIVPERVESVDRSEGGFSVTTDDGRTVTSARVVAATKYDGEYLRGLDGDDAMFESQVHGDESQGQDRFSREYADRDGRTPVDGLYVAGPLAGVGDQALIAAGHGAQVACEVIEDVRREAGYWDEIADYYDWVRRESELNGEWADPDRWRAWFDDQVPADVDADEATIERLRERYVEERFAMYVSAAERAERAEAGHRRLASHLDIDLESEPECACESETESDVDHTERTGGDGSP